MKIKKVDDKPMVIHTKKKAKLLAQNECSDMKEELSILKHLEIFDRDILDKLICEIKGRTYRSKIWYNSRWEIKSLVSYQKNQNFFLLDTSRSSTLSKSKTND